MYLIEQAGLNPRLGFHASKTRLALGGPVTFAALSPTSR